MRACLIALCLKTARLPTTLKAAVWLSGCGVELITAKVWVRFRSAARAIGVSPRAGSPDCPQCGCVGPDGVESSLGPAPGWWQQLVLDQLDCERRRTG